MNYCQHIVNVEKQPFSILQTNTCQQVVGDNIYQWKEKDLNMMPFTIYVLTACIVILLLMWRDDKRNGRY